MQQKIPPRSKHPRFPEQSKPDKKPRRFPNQPQEPTEEEEQRAEQRIRDKRGGDSYWMVNKTITRKIGVEAAVFLDDLLFKWTQYKGKLSPEGYFFNTEEYRKRDTGLSRRKQRRAIKVLVELGILYPVIRKGVPPRQQFKFHFKAIEALFFNDSTNHVEPTGLEKED